MGGGIIVKSPATTFKAKHKMNLGRKAALNQQFETQ